MSFFALAAVVLGIFFRIGNFLSDKSLWCDEWLSVEIASGPFREVIFPVLANLHPPGFFLLLRSSIQLFGMNLFSFHVWPLLLGLGTVAAIYFLAKELFDAKTAWIALILASLSPALIYLSHEVRNHGAPALTCAVATIFFLQYLRRPTRFTAWAYGIMGLMSFWMHHLSWFWWGALLLYGHLETRQSPSRSQYWRLQAWVFVAALPALGLFIWRYLHQVDYTTATLLPQNAPFTFKTIKFVYHNLLFGVDVYDPSGAKPIWVWALRLVFFLASGLLVWQISKTRKNQAIFLAIVLVVPILALGLFVPVFFDYRYFGFLMPFLLITLAAALNRLGKPMMYLATISLCSIYIWGNVEMLKLKTSPLHGDDYPQMLSLVLKLATPQDSVIIRKKGVYEFYLSRSGAHPHTHLVSDPEEIQNDAHKVYLMDDYDFREINRVQERLREKGFQEIPTGPALGDQPFYDIAVFEKKTV